MILMVQSCIHPASSEHLLHWHILSQKGHKALCDSAFSSSASKKPFLLVPGSASKPNIGVGER